MRTGMTNAFRRFLQSCALVAFAGLPLASTAKEEAPDPAETVSAVTQTQEIDFYFQSFNTFYSCHSLEDRVRQLLVALGADKNMRVRVTSCFGNEIARFPNVRIQLSSPVEATPEVLAELEKTRSTRELTARVRGEPMVEPTAQYPAYWKPVSLSRGSFRLEPGDCELVDVDGDHVYVSLSGACNGCQMEAQTLNGVRERLSERLGRPTHVVPVNAQH